MGEDSRISSSCCGRLRVTRCCCGCTLKTGCLIIGSLHMIWAIVAIGVGLGLLVYFNIVGQSLGWHREALTTINISFGGLLAGGVAQCIHSAILIHGTRKGKAGFLFCWEMFYIIGMVLTAIGLVLQAGLWGIVSTVVGLLFGVYFYIVVNSYRLELMAGGENSNIEGKATSSHAMAHYNQNMHRQNMYHQNMSHIQQNLHNIQQKY